MITPLLRSLARSIMSPVVLACAVSNASCEGSTASPTSPTTSITPMTFNLTGSVRDTILRPVADARVDIADGPLAGRFTTTDSTGRFAFVDLTPGAETATLRVSKDGYISVTILARNNRGAGVTLVPDAVVPLEGEYEVTFTAASACADIPAVFRKRTYVATINPSPYGSVSSHASVMVFLGGADFYPRYEVFSGLLANDAVRLSVFSRYAFDQWLEDQPIFERLGSTTYLSVMGTAIATGARPNAPIAAVMDGTISYCSSATVHPLRPDFPPWCSVPAVECRSSQHQVALTRR